MKDMTEFYTNILKDLIKKGYSDYALVKEFELRKQNMKLALSNLLEEADSIAAGEIPAASLDDIFNLNN